MYEGVWIRKASYDKWYECAKSLGFDTVKQMLYSLYFIQSLSLRSIERKLGFDYTIIQILLHKFGFNLRSRGGHNRLPMKQQNV